MQQQLPQESLSTRLAYKLQKEQLHLLLAWVSSCQPSCTSCTGQDNWQGRHVSEMNGDHTSWDVAPLLIDLLSKFFHICFSQSLSLVNLQMHPVYHMGWELSPAEAHLNESNLLRNSRHNTGLPLPQKLGCNQLFRRPCHTIHCDSRV